MTKRCSVEGCEGNSRKVGMCDMHYWRVKRNGETGPSRSSRAKAGEPLQWLLDHVGYGGQGCLIWPFAKSSKGYGSLRPAGGMTQAAHRRMCSERHGPPPSPKFDAAHSCGNGHRGCVHPEHLRWATRADNMTDRDTHGRTQRGARHSNARLNDESVKQIRLLHKQGTAEADLARSFSVSPSAINNVINNQTWKHVL